LFEDRGEVGFSHIVGEGAVAEDNGGLSSGGLFLVPRHQPGGQGLHIGLRDGFGEACKQGARSDAVDCMACDFPGFDGHAEFEAELEQQLEENVLLGAVGLEMIHGGFEALGEVLAVRVPLADVCGIQLENTEADIAREERVLLFDLLSGPAQAFFG
jgi:hypothetical protein